MLVPADLGDDVPFARIEEIFSRLIIIFECGKSVFKPFNVAAGSAVTGEVVELKSDINLGIVRCVPILPVDG